MILRESYFSAIQKEFRIHSVVAILGPRQCGKTTLANKFAADFINNTGGPVTHFDLEDATDIAKLQNPKLTLDSLEGLIIIDEIQRIPELFTYLRVLVDRHPKRRYLILGSASRDLINQSSETLAGRIGYIELTPFQLNEVWDVQKLWRRGGFPKSYLAEDDDSSERWRRGYIKTFLERDLQLLGIQTSIDMRRLWTMLAHTHGNTLNYSDLGRSLGYSDQTMRRQVSNLAGTFMIRELAPWFENIAKRQVKTPKIYMRDSGLLHTLLGIQDITMHPKLGASWEGFALEEIIRSLAVDPEDCYFWGTVSGAELDLMILHHGKRIGFEFKYADVPKVSKSIHIAFETLKLDDLYIITPQDTNYQIANNICVMGISSFLKR